MKTGIEVINEIMEKDNISQTELAEKLKVDRRNLNQTLRRNKDIKYNQVEEMLDKMGYKIEVVKQ